MKRVLHINVTAGTGSTGKVAEGIARAAAKAGYENMILFGRGEKGSEFPAVRLGRRYDFLKNVVRTRLRDEHGMSLRAETKKALMKIEQDFRPDIVHLHNIHGYWINVPELMAWLRHINAPIVWTLHDCWPLTGHCAHFLPFGCMKWQTECGDCPALQSYPATLGGDRSGRNFQRKKEMFRTVSNRLNIVAVSRWLDSVVAKSFLKDARHTFIHNGIDTSAYKPFTEEAAKKKEKILKRFGINPEDNVILCAASKWIAEKGSQSLPELARSLPEGFRLIVAGKTDRRLHKELTDAGAVVIGEVASAGDMCDLYNVADCFANPTLADSLPTVNLEAQSCGTPVVSYDSGGCRETVADTPGAIVEAGNAAALAKEATAFCKLKESLSHECRKFIELHFDAEKQFRQYVELYDRLT